MRVLALVCLCSLLSGCAHYTYQLHIADGRDEMKLMKKDLERHDYKVIWIIRDGNQYKIRTKRKVR